MRGNTTRALGRAIRRGGLPRATRQLLVDVVRLELRSVADHLAARCRPILGTGRWRLPGAETRVIDGRRVIVRGRLDRPVDAVRSTDATEICDGLRAHGLTAATRRSPEGLEIWTDDESAAAVNGAIADLCVPATTGFHAVATGSKLPSIHRHYGLGRRHSVSTRVDLRHGRGERAADGALPPIDMVVTWVDPNADGWQAAFSDVAAGVDDIAAHPSRYESHDELRYALRSIWFHCGWFRHLHLVTSGERPSWLRPSDRLTVVDHASFMPADALPTFNSHAIESQLHHVPDLAERFVYVNDDFFVGRPTEPADFFAHELSDPVVTALDAQMPDLDTTTPGQLQATHLTRELLAARDGFHGTRLLHHAPYSNRVSFLRALEAEFPTEFERTAHSRFRARSDLSVPSSLGPWAAIADGRGVLGSHQVEYVSLGHPTTKLRLRKITRDAPVFWCANRTEHSAPGAHAADVERTLRRLYPEAAPWEA